MLAFNSKPINSVSALKLIHSIRATKAPIEPKNLLNWAKLFTKYENPNDATIVSNVASVEPAEKNLQLVFLTGAR